MARISEQSIEKVRQAADIVEVVSGYIDLKQRGRNFLGLCPFHNDNKPSLTVSPEKQIYKCFSCNAGGGAINFVMEIDKLEFADAIKHLAQSFNITLDIKGGDSKKFSDLKSQLLAIHELATNQYQKNLDTTAGRKALGYLKERGLSDKIIADFKIGFSLDSWDDLLELIRKEKFSAEAMKLSGLFIQTERGYINRFRSRIMFPIQNYNGNVIAFGGRIFDKDDNAKYQNSPDTPIYNKSNILYGLNHNAENIRTSKKVILVEGNMDLLQLTQAGINNCLAICGTAFTEGHANILKRYTKNISITFDGDEAGKKAAIKCGYILSNNSVEPKIIIPPNGMDPDDWIREKGVDEFQKHIENAIDIIKAHYNYFSENAQDGALSINEFIQECLDELVNIKDPIMQEIMTKRLSEITSIDQRNIIQVLNEKNKKKNRFKTNAPKSEVSTITEIQNTSYSIKVFDDLIRLCFSPEKEIREFIFDNIEKNWIKSDPHKEIFDLVYIHLKGNEEAPISIIAEQINNKSLREKLIDITFNLDKFIPNRSMAIDCAIRMEQSFIQNEIDLLREKLKEIDDDNDNSDVINQLSSFEKKITDIKNKYNEK